MDTTIKLVKITHNSIRSIPLDWLGDGDNTGEGVRDSGEGDTDGGDNPGEGINGGSGVGDIGAGVQEMVGDVSLPLLHSYSVVPLLVYPFAHAATQLVPVSIVAPAVQSMPLKGIV